MYFMTRGTHAVDPVFIFSFKMWLSSMKPMYMGLCVSAALRPSKWVSDSFQMSKIKVKPRGSVTKKKLFRNESLLLWVSLRRSSTPLLRGIHFGLQPSFALAVCIFQVWIRCSVGWSSLSFPLCQVLHQRHQLCIILPAHPPLLPTCPPLFLWNSWTGHGGIVDFVNLSVDQDHCESVGLFTIQLQVDSF